MKTIKSKIAWAKMAFINRKHWLLSIQYMCNNNSSAALYRSETWGKMIDRIEERYLDFVNEERWNCLNAEFMTSDSILNEIDDFRELLR